VLMVVLGCKKTPHSGQEDAGKRNKKRMGSIRKCVKSQAPRLEPRVTRVLESLCIGWKIF
jgi:hypothetical protein